MKLMSRGRVGSLKNKKKDMLFSCALAAGGYFYGAIMMQNDPIKIQDVVIKTKKGLRS